MDTNPYILGLTVIVSIVHSIFEFLAFKNGEEDKCVHVHGMGGGYGHRLVTSRYPEVS